MRLLLLAPLLSLNFHQGYAIISGRTATPHEYPSGASLIARGISFEDHACGATIIGKTAALTAAHCCEDRQASNLKIRVGSNDRTEGGTTLRVFELIKHPDWNRYTIDANFCILRTEDIPLQEGSVEQAPLPSSPATGDKLPILAAGWGKTDPQGESLPSEMQTENFTLIDHEKCNKAWEDVNPITENMICFGPSAGAKPTLSACNGDGGGAVYDASNGKLLGVISHGEDKCSTGLPNVAANVASVRDWICQNSGV